MLARLLIHLNLWTATLAFHTAPRSFTSRLRVTKAVLNQQHAHKKGDFDAATSISCEDIDRLESPHQYGVSRRTALELIAGASFASVCTVLPNAHAITGGRPSPNVELFTTDRKDISMPLIAYSFYKTSPEQAPRGLALALRSGIRHFDLASDYGNFNEIAPILRQYFATGKIDWNFDDEKEDLVKLLDDTRKAGGGSKKSRGTKQARQDVFLTYKLSNDEQSADASSIRDKVHSLLSRLETPYLDLVCIHSPLPGSERRLATYKTLLQLKEEGLIRSVGVCNYGLCHLKELVANDLPLPSVNQLEISPFNAHGPIVQFCEENNIQVSCAAWSKLSSVSGPVEQWTKLGDLANDKGVTKAQILVRWALQKGYGCAPRSGTKSKLEVMMLLFVIILRSIVY